jgi:hypothetical protein
MRELHGIPADSENPSGTSDLSSGDFSVNFAAGNYDYTLLGFAEGDRLAFASGKG